MQNYYSRNMNGMKLKRLSVSSLSQIFFSLHIIWAKSHYQPDNHHASHIYKYLPGPNDLLTTGTDDPTLKIIWWIVAFREV